VEEVEEEVEEESEEAIKENDIAIFDSSIDFNLMPKIIEINLDSD
jgi:hypothetical protein